MGFINKKYKLLKFISIIILFTFLWNELFLNYAYLKKGTLTPPCICAKENAPRTQKARTITRKNITPLEIETRTPGIREHWHISRPYKVTAPLEHTSVEFYVFQKNGYGTSKNDRARNIPSHPIYQFCILVSIQGTSETARTYEEKIARNIEKRIKYILKTKKIRAPHAKINQQNTGQIAHWNIVYTAKKLTPHTDQVWYAMDQAVREIAQVLTARSTRTHSASTDKNKKTKPNAPDIKEVELVFEGIGTIVIPIENLPHALQKKIRANTPLTHLDIDTIPQEAFPPQIAEEMDRILKGEYQEFQKDPKAYREKYAQTPEITSLPKRGFWYMLRSPLEKMITRKIAQFPKKMTRWQKIFYFFPLASLGMIVGYLPWLAMKDYSIDGVTMNMLSALQGIFVYFYSTLMLKDDPDRLKLVWIIGATIGIFLYIGTNLLIPGKQLSEFGIGFFLVLINYICFAIQSAYITKCTEGDPVIELDFSTISSPHLSASTIVNDLKEKSIPDAHGEKISIIDSKKQVLKVNVENTQTQEIIKTFLKGKQYSESDITAVLEVLKKTQQTQWRPIALAAAGFGFSALIALFAHISWPVAFYCTYFFTTPEGMILAGLTIVITIGSLLREKRGENKVPFSYAHLGYVILRSLLISILIVSIISGILQSIGYITPLLFPEIAQMIPPSLLSPETFMTTTLTATPLTLPPISNVILSIPTLLLDIFRNLLLDPISLIGLGLFLGYICNDIGKWILRNTASKVIPDASIVSTILTLVPFVALLMAPLFGLSTLDERFSTQLLGVATALSMCITIFSNIVIAKLKKIKDTLKKTNSTSKIKAPITLIIRDWFIKPIGKAVLNGIIHVWKKGILKSIRDFTKKLFSKDSPSFKIMPLLKQCSIVLLIGALLITSGMGSTLGKTITTIGKKSLSIPQILFSLGLVAFLGTLFVWFFTDKIWPMLLDIKGLLSKINPRRVGLSHAVFEKIIQPPHPPAYLPAAKENLDINPQFKSIMTSA